MPALLRAQTPSGQLKAQDKASQIDLGFPNNILTKDRTRSVIFGGMEDRIIA